MEITGELSALTHISGVVESVIFTNEENGYTVAEVSMGKGISVTVVGIMPMVSPGELLEADGAFTVHQSYGAQFEARSVLRAFPEKAAGILKYLAFGGVKGVGAVTARKLVEKFGDDTLEVIRRTPEKLTAVAGITEKRAKAIGDAFASRFALRSLSEFLSEQGLETSLATGLYRKYGADAPDVIRENPYILCESPWEVNFFQMDEIARDMGFEEDCYERIVAAILFELAYNAGEGHCFLPADKLCEAAGTLLGNSTDEVPGVLEDLVEGRRLVSEPLGKVTAVYLPALYEAEIFCAQRLAFLLQRSFRDIRNAEALLEKVEEKLGISYAPLQREAILMAASRGVLAITGGPGTGKTTIVKAMLALFEYSGSSCELAAPTGRAAKRLGEVCGREARTIHRLLEVSFNENGQQFLHNEKNPLSADVIIVDEMSMVDIELFASLLKAVKNGARLILVGDADQLPSVGPGSVLRDLLGVAGVPQIRLTEIFRQAEQSAIVVNAHRINRGERVPLDNKQSDFFFLRRNDPKEAAETIVELVKTRLPGRMGFDPSQIQVLTPTRRGDSGTGYLNNLLQQALNPPDPVKKEKHMAGYVLREGDRVMQVMNNYDISWSRAGGAESGMGVFNGDIGVLKSISAVTETATVVYDDREAVYDFESLRQLELAYAATVHKAQGSEYPAVILAACMTRSRLLFRSLLYTGVTRAKKLLIVVGREDTLQTMIDSDVRLRRYSGLKLRLGALLEGDGK